MGFNSGFKGLISDKNRGYFTRIEGTLQEDQNTFLVIPRSILLRIRNVSDKNCIENQDTRFMFNNFFYNIAPFKR